MDSKSRIIAKAVTWQVMGFCVMLALGSAMTGSLKSGGGFAIFSTVLGFVSYFGHEVLWARIAWGRVGVPRRDA